MTQELETTRRDFLRKTAAIAVNPLNPDISGLSELEDALRESETDEVAPSGYTELIKDEESVALIYIPGDSYYNDGFWMWKNRTNIEEASPWAILEDFDRGVNSEINRTFTRSFGSQEAFLTHFFENADKLENEALYTATLDLYKSPDGVIPESGNSRPDIIQTLDGNFEIPEVSNWGWVHGNQFDLYLDNDKQKAIVLPHLSEASQTIGEALEIYGEIPDFMDESLPYVKSVSDYLETSFERDEEIVIRLASKDYSFELY